MADCPKCGGTTSEGFLVDQGDYGMNYQARWHRGSPQKAWWGGLKVRKADLIPVETYRCNRCGFLEQYAKDASSGL